ncbi:MAG: sulfurtransferase, partial [Methanobacteriota archaeon]
MRKRIFTWQHTSIGLVLLALILTSACLATEKPQTPVEAGKVASAGGYANPDAVVSAEWLSSRLDEPHIKVIEVGSSKAGYEEHIPGAVYVDWRLDIADPHSQVENMVASKERIEGLLSRLGINRDDTIVVYDLNGNVLAGRMYWVLKYYGHRDVRFLNGGKRLWTEKGLPLSKEEPAPEAAAYSIEAMNPEYRVTWDYVKEALDNPDVVIVDVRSKEEYTGEKALAKRGGHIPGAVNVYWKQTLNDDGTLKQAGELQKLYESSVATGDKEVLVYCHSGVRSAYTW